MKTEQWRNIKDALTIAVLLFVGWKTWQIEQIKPNIVTVTEYIPGDTTNIIKVVPTVRTIMGNDTVIYLTQIVRDTVRQTDTIQVRAGQTVYNDTLRLDSLGYVAGLHVVTGTLNQSAYTPHLNRKVTTRTETIIKEPIRVYGNIVTGFKTIAPGISLSHKYIEAGYNYDPFNNTHQVRAGYRIWHLF